MSAAKKNYLVLGKYDFNLEQAIQAQIDSPIGYGSEFRKSEVLSPLLHKHPLWPQLKDILQHGVKFPIEPLDEESRAKDVELALEFGNHKGATEQQDLLTELCKKDIDFGYGLVLPLDKIKKIPGVVLAPLNIAPQNTIDEFGRIVPKNRLTHDQSFCFKGGSGTSVNNRVRKQDLPPCMFGACIRRLVNWIVAARRKHPNCRIPMSKIDFKSAFRRMHLNSEVAVQSCTQLPHLNIAIMSTRLTFGGCPNPAMWGMASETCTDLANAIQHDPDWNPKSLHSESQHLVPDYKPLPDNIPFATAKELFVDLQINEKGLVDCYIDDLIDLTVDLPDSDNVLRNAAAVLLAINVLARPLSKNEPIPRENGGTEETLGRSRT